MFVDEIEPEEAFGLPSGWIAKRGEDVPRGGDDQEDDGAGDEAHPEQVTMVTYQQQENENDGGGKDDADQAFGADVESDGDGESPTREKRMDCRIASRRRRSRGRDQSKGRREDRE